MTAIGHNNPPDPIDQALAPYGDVIEEAQNWLDGEPVTDEGQMRAVDKLLRGIKEAHKAVADADESETKPLYDQWKAAKARFKPTLDDLDRMKKGLAALVDGFKRRLAAEKAEAERKARDAAEAAQREAARLAAEARAGDIEAERARDKAIADAEAATKAASAAGRDQVKGLYTVTRYEITDHRALLHWIAANRRDDITAFLDEWARQNHRAVGPIPGALNVWQEKVAK